MKIIAILTILIPFLVSDIIIRDVSEASDVTPFYTQNQNPLVQIYGLPPSEDALLVSKGKILSRLVFNLANNSVIDSNSQENITLDGETQRVNLSFRYGIANGMEVGVDIPYIAHRGGALDSFIESFHGFFGLPQGDRKDLENNSLNFRYIRDGKTVLHIDNATSGFGDIMFSFGKQLYHAKEDNVRDVSIKLSIKLPTGNSNDLHGSGSTDLSFRLLATDGDSLSRWELTLLGSTGLLLMNNGDVLEDQQRHLVGFGSFGIGWQPFEWLIPKIQLDWHSPFYINSDLKEINSWSAQIAMGGSIALPNNTLLDLAVVEDIIVNTAPDVVFHLGLRKKF